MIHQKFSISSLEIIHTFIFKPFNCQCGVSSTRWCYL